MAQSRIWRILVIPKIRQYCFITNCVVDPFLFVRSPEGLQRNIGFKKKKIKTRISAIITNLRHDINVSAATSRCGMILLTIIHLVVQLMSGKYSLKRRTSACIPPNLLLSH